MVGGVAGHCGLRGVEGMAVVGRAWKMVAGVWNAGRTIVVTCIRGRAIPARRESEEVGGRIGLRRPR